MTNTPVPYTGAAGSSPGGDNIFNYPITGSPQNTIYGQMMMYTGIVTPYTNTGHADTSFLHVPGGQPTYVDPGAPQPTQVDKPVNVLHPWDAVSAVLGDTTNQAYSQTPYGVAQGHGLPNPALPGSQSGANFEQVPVSQFVASFANQDQAQIKALQQKLVAANILNGAFTYGLYDDATRAAVFHMAVYTAAKNDPHIDFFTLLNNSVKIQQQMAGKAAVTTTSHDSSTVFSNPEQAKALVTGTMAQLLGRNPTDAEMSQLAGALHSSEAAHPAQTTTTTKTNNLGQIIDRNSVSTQGETDAERQYALTQAAQQNPDYQRYQQVALYGPALMSMLGPTTAAGQGNG